MREQREGKGGSELEINDQNASEILVQAPGGPGFDSSDEQKACAPLACTPSQVCLAFPPNTLFPLGARPASHHMLSLLRAISSNLCSLSPTSVLHQVVTHLGKPPSLQHLLCLGSTSNPSSDSSRSLTALTDGDLNSSTHTHRDMTSTLFMQQGHRPGDNCGPAGQSCF
ncbi:hypothetical protein BR93DRAFT_726445 [Coniochaeta sp. PMI_546]|nr:hypothetical protein BR93DRAFT_726445 [Coniochaeta sp. PMI_546]